MSVDLDSLDPETLALAFWLQEKIYEEGIEGVHFMRAARLWAEKHADETVAANINKELRKL